MRARRYRGGVEPRLHPNVLSLTPLMSYIVLPVLVADGLRLLAHAYTDPAVLPFSRPLLRVSVSSFCRALIYLALRCVYVPMHLLFSLPHVFPPFVSDCVTPLDNAPLSLCLPCLDSPHTHTRRLHCHPHPHLHQVSCKLHTLYYSSCLALCLWLPAYTNG